MEEIKEDEKDKIYFDILDMCLFSILEYQEIKQTENYIRFKSIILARAS